MTHVVLTELRDERQHPRPALLLRGTSTSERPVAGGLHGQHPEAHPAAAASRGPGVGGCQATKHTSLDGHLVHDGVRDRNRIAHGLAAGVASAGSK